MDRIASYSHIIQNYLSEKASVPFSPGVALKLVVIADTTAHQYILLTVGEQKGEKVHSIDIHIAIENEKVVVLLDNTEWNVRKQLEAAGIAREDFIDATQPLDFIKK